MALPVNGSTHLIPAYYSFIDKERMKGWVGLVGWPVADGLPSGHPSAAGRTQDKECSPVRDRRSTTVPRRQPIYKLYQLGKEEYLRPFIRIALDWNVRSCWTYCWSWMEHAKRRSASTSPPWPGVSLDSLVFVQKVSRIALCDQCEFMWPGIKTVCVMSAYCRYQAKCNEELDHYATQ